MVNYLCKIVVKSSSISTLSVTSVIAPVHASSILSVQTSDDKHQEILDKFPGTIFGEKILAEILAKFPDDVTLTLQM